MADVSFAAALVLALVFGWSAFAKARAVGATAASFRGLGLPSSRALTKAVVLAEGATAAVLVLRPAAGAWIALALLLAFSVVIGRAVARRVDVACACFGSTSTRPVSTIELLRNGGLAALAIVATGSPTGLASRATLPALVCVTVLTALARVVLALLELRKLGGHVFATPLPGEARR
jgi:hypothetical protein